MRISDWSSDVCSSDLGRSGMARHGRALLVSGAVLGIGALGLAGLTAQPPGAAPKARYWMDVATTSGFMGGGGNPLAMLRGGGGGASHQLTLRLGSTEAATGTPEIGRAHV